MSNERLTRNQQREAARAKAKAMREAQKKNEGRKRAAILLSSIVGGLALVAVVVVAIMGQAAKSVDNGSDPKFALVNGGFTITKDLKLAKTVGEIDKNVPTIIIYQDLQCPACQAFELPNMPQIAELVKAGSYNLEIHPIGMLDGYSLNEYATRASSALVCVAEGAPERFLDYNAALYNAQPKENTAGPDNNALAATAESLGVTDTDTLDCIRNANWATWTYNQTPAYKSIVPGTTDVQFQGTPCIVVNGKQYAGELNNPAMFLQWLQEVAPV